MLLDLTWAPAHETHPWVEIYRGPNRLCTAEGLQVCVMRLHCDALAPRCSRADNGRALPQPHSSYCFRVMAVNSSGSSSWSPASVFTTGKPAAPRELLLLQRTPRSLTVAWQVCVRARTRESA